MYEADRIRYNNNRLQELHPSFRTRIEAILKELESFGYRPRIQVAWRSPAEQLQAYRSGKSKVQYGFHNVTGAAGVKEALAADIWDDDRLEKVKVDFMLHLAAAAEAQSLTTGIRWDLADEDSVLIDIALKHKNWDAKLRVGWDPLHVEPVGITPEEAKNGRRLEPLQQPTGGTNTQPPPADSTQPPDPQRPTTMQYRVQNLTTNESRDFTLSTPLKPVSLLPVPYVSQLAEDAQSRKNDCGAACAVMLLKAYQNISMTPDEYYIKFNIAGDPYLSVQTLRNTMGSLGLLTDFKAGLTYPDLFNLFAAGKPVILLLLYQILKDAGLTEKTFDGPHFAVAVGMDTKYIYIHDPLFTDPAEGEARAYPLDIFWNAWKRVAESKFPNPERSAIIPTVGLGFRMERRVKVNIALLNIRSGPGLNYNLIGSLKKDQVVVSKREMSGWGEIADGRWIYLAYTVPAPQQ
jgi:hypothetical protein